MGLKYNPATGKLLRTNTPRLVNECAEVIEATCLNTNFMYTLAGVTTGAPCSAGDCTAFNTTYTLPPDGSAIAQLSGCQPITLCGDQIIDNPDYSCGYHLNISRCGLTGTETFSLDAVIYGVIGVGWVAQVGIKSPGNYNFGGGGVSDYCQVMIAEICPGESGLLIDFAYNFDPDVDGCASCNVTACNFINMTIAGSVQLQ